MSHAPPLARLAIAIALLGPIVQLDHTVQSAVQTARTPELEKPMRTASSTRQGAVVCGGLLIVAIATGPAGPATARAVLAALVPVNLVVEGLKLSVNRPRPDGERHRVNSSFPSSHAANAATIALVLGLRWPRLAPAFWLLASLVAYSRMYLNRHFLSDVLVGMALGVGLSLLTVRWLRERGWTWHARP
jgi:undecaprenyl-diphosphatase